MTRKAQLPDGTVLEFPDGTADTVIDGVVKQHLSAAPQQTSAQPDRVADVSLSDLVTGNRGPENIPSVLSPEFEKVAGGGSFGGRLGYSASQVIPSLFKGDAGVRQRAVEAVPGSKVETDASGAEIVVTPQGERFYVNKPGLDVDDAFRFGGNLAAFTPAGRLVRGATLAPRLVTAAAGAAATDAAGQAASGQGVDTGQVATSGAFGAFGQGIGDALMASGKAAAKAITPELRKVFDAAKARGIDLFPWQVAEGSFAGKARGVAAAAPFSGAGKRSANQSAQFQREVAKTIGEPLQQGESLTPEVLGRAADRIGKQFDAVFTPGTRVDQAFYRDVLTAAKEAQDTGSDQAINAANAFLDRVRRQGQGGMNGKTLQSLDRQARALQQSGDPDRVALGGALRDSLHNVFSRHAPAGSKAAFDAARRQWANLKTIEPVVARTGTVPPQQLLGAVNATKTGRTAVARGRGGELGELGRIGQQLKPAQSSQTAENIFGGGLLVGGALNLPLALKALAVGNVGARALDSPAVTRMLLSQNRGQARQAVAPLLRPLPLGFAPRSSDEKP